MLATVLGYVAIAVVGLAALAGIGLLSLFLLMKMQKKVGIGSGGSLEDRYREFGSIKVEVCKPKERFEDVIGCEEAKDEVWDITDSMENPGKYLEMGAETSRGLLLVGPPGTGKTMMARATAGEAQCDFLSISGSECEEMLVGTGASRVRHLFEEARKRDRCFIFIDEVDIIGGRRGIGGLSQGTADQTLSQLLVEMDGIKKKDEQLIVTMGATNRPEGLDPALLRRFERKAMILLPDQDQRLGILAKYTKNKQLGPDVNLARIARATMMFSGADLKILCNEAALFAIKRGQKFITNTDLQDAIDKVIYGPAHKKKSAMSKEDREWVAWHEAGHAYVTKMLPASDPLRKVTILARGLAGGITWHEADETKRRKTSLYFNSKLAVLMAGGAAEQVRYGDVSTGVDGDIMEATKIAQAMICRHGMSAKVGRLALSQSNDFLGVTSESLKCSEATKRIVDLEQREFVENGFRQALNLLKPKKHRNNVEKIAEALLARETLMNEEVEEIIKFKTPA